MPYFRHIWQAVEGQCKIINYQHGVIRIIIMPLLPVQLSAVLNTTIHYPSLVS